MIRLLRALVLLVATTELCQAVFFELEVDQDECFTIQVKRGKKFFGEYVVSG
jgi:hypothetical protein